MDEPDEQLLDLCGAWNDTPEPKPTPRQFCEDNGVPELVGPFEAALGRLAAHDAALRAMWGSPGSPPADEGAVPPDVIDGFEVLGELGRGGMGVVYRVREATTERALALKMVLAGRHADGPARARFVREVRSTAALVHENIVRLHAVGSCAEGVYFTMELIEGGNLAARLADYVPGCARARAERQCRQRVVAELIAGAARGAHHAHERGIIHRDLKPANVLLRAPAVACISDFGLAWLAGSDELITLTGDNLGTPHYMAPEQVAGGPVGRPTDVWALGVILYELLTGRRPFDGDTRFETMQQVARAEFAHPRAVAPAVARDLETVCLKCLQLDPDRRYATAAALAEDLERWLRGEPVRARRPSLTRLAALWVRRNKWPAAAMAVMFALSTVLALTARELDTTNADLKTTSHELTERNIQLDGKTVALDAKVVELDHTNAALKDKTVALDTKVADLNTANAALGAKSQALVEKDRQSRAALRQAGEVALGRGSALCADGDPRAGVLWLAHALELAERAGADDLARLVRANLASWLERVPLVRAVLPNDGHVFETRFGPDGTRLLVWLDNFRGVRLWDAATGAPCGNLTPRLWVPGVGTLRLPVSAVAFGPNDTVLTFAAGRVDFWRARDGAPAAAPLFLDGHGHFSFSADGTRGAVAAYTAEAQLGAGGSAVRKYRVRVFDLVARKPVGRPFWLGSCTRLAPDGKALLTIDTDGATVSLWDVDRHQRRPNPLAHDGPVHAAEFTPSGNLVWSLDDKRRLQFWNPATGAKAHAQPMLDQTTGFVLHPDEKTLICPNEGRPVYMDDGKRKFAVYDVGGRQHERWLTAESFPTVMRFTPDGRHVVTAERGDRIQLRDYASNAPVGPVFGHFSNATGHQGYVSHVAFSPDGTRMATHDDSGRVFVWDTPREPPAAPGPARPRPADAPAKLAPDVVRTVRAAGVIATAHRTGDVRLWAEGTLRPLGDVLEAGAPVTALHADPRGTVLVIGRATGGVTVWHPTERRRVAGPLAHDGPVTAADVHPATGHLLTACDRNVHLWDYAKGAPLAKFPHDLGVSRVAFDADGRRALTSSANTVQLWDVPLRAPLGAPFRHAGFVTGAGFGPGPDDVTAEAGPGGVRVWAVPAPDPAPLADLVRKVHARTRYRLDTNGTPALIPEAEWRKDFAAHLPPRPAAP